jgi:hypothetical protein
MQNSSSNILLSFGFRLAVEVAILLLAIIAARRNRLKGLWILVLAALLTVIHDALTMGSFTWSRSGHDDTMGATAWLQHIPLVTMVIVLFGWLVLAFSSRKGVKTS